MRCSVVDDYFELPTLLWRLGWTEATIRAEALEAFLGDGTKRVCRVEIQHGQVAKLHYLLLRLPFTTYRNSELNHAVGVDIDFPIIGWTSIGGVALIDITSNARIVMW